MRAVVELWGKEVGIIDQREDDVVASFQFAPGFDYDISPLLMPISRMDGVPQVDRKRSLWRKRSRPSLQACPEGR